MHIVVMGAGALGGYYGGKLAAHDVPVTFLVRANRFQQLKERGLRIQSIHGDLHINPQLATEAADIEAPDVVLLGLKNYHLADALPSLHTLVQRGAVILPMLNGIIHMETLTNAFGVEKVMGGASHIEATLNATGDVIQTSKLQSLVYGPLSNQISDTWLRELDETLAKGEFQAKHSDNILLDMWQKYMFLSTFSGMTAATRQPVGHILQDEYTRNFLLQVIQEVVAIAKAEFPAVPAESVDAVLARMYKVEPTMTSSMYRDLEKGRPIELEDLHGVLLRMAKDHAIATPALAAIFALLHPYVQGVKPGH